MNPILTYQYNENDKLIYVVSKMSSRNVVKNVEISKFGFNDRHLGGISIIFIARAKIRVTLKSNITKKFPATTLEPMINM